MKTVLLIFALASPCLLHAEVEIPTATNFDPEKFLGTWYFNQLIPNGMPPDTFQVIDYIVETSGDDGLLIHRRYKQDERCDENVFNLKPTDKLGKYVALGSGKIMNIVAFAPRSYYIAHVQLKDKSFLYLSSRKKEASKKASKKFRSVAKRLGFDVNDIIHEVPADPC